MSAIPPAAAKVALCAGAAVVPGATLATVCAPSRPKPWDRPRSPSVNPKAKGGGRTRVAPTSAAESRRWRCKPTSAWGMGVSLSPHPPWASRVGHAHRRTRRQCLHHCRPELRPRRSRTSASRNLRRRRSHARGTVGDARMRRPKRKESGGGGGGGGWWGVGLGRGDAWSKGADVEEG